MADDQDKPRPNLEPPKLFGRRQRPEKSGDERDAELDLPPAAEPSVDPVPVAEPPTEVLPISDPTWTYDAPLAEPEPAPAPIPEPAPAPQEESREAAMAVLPAEAGTPLFADEVEDAAVRTKIRRTRARREPKPPKATRPPKAPRAPRAPRASRSRPALPTVSGWVAAAATGLLIGLLLVGLTAGSLQGCEAVRGTSTCGGSGAIILILIMALLVALGGFLLKLSGVPDPGSTSFLAVGMVAVITLLFLLDLVENWWIVLVIPPIAVAMYLLAYWVTTTFVDGAQTEG